MEIKHNIKNFYAGDSLNITISHDTFKPSMGYSCKLVLMNATDLKTEWFLNSDSEKEVFTVNKNNLDTSTITPNTYHCFVSIYNNDELFAKQYDIGLIDVKPDITTLENFDTRSPAQKRLDALYILKEKRIKDGVQSFSINGRTINLLSESDINKAIEIEKKIVAKELRLEELKNKGGTNRNKLKIRYNGMKVY